MPKLGHKSNEVTTSWITPEEDEIDEIYQPTYIYNDSPNVFQDVYSAIQMRGLQQATAKLATFLEELNNVDLDGAIEELVALLEKDDYIMLLPGVTPAYALRTRKWSTNSIQL